MFIDTNSEQLRTPHSISVDENRYRCESAMAHPLACSAYFLKSSLDAMSSST